MVTLSLSLPLKPSVCNLLPLSIPTRNSFLPARGVTRCRVHPLYSRGFSPVFYPSRRPSEASFFRLIPLLLSVNLSPAPDCSFIRAPYTSPVTPPSVSFPVPCSITCALPPARSSGWLSRSLPHALPLFSCRDYRAPPFYLSASRSGKSLQFF